jgi:TetR/AcrR family transcriptional repressor of nem operon
MRYAANQKEQTRQRVLKAAAAQIRVRGPDGVSVAELMREAGLTHGGFYAHFASKDALVAAAIKTMFEDVVRRRSHLIEGRTGPDALSIFIDLYMDASHRDQPERGCPVAALLGQAAHLPQLARPAFDTGVRGMVRIVAAQLPDHIDGDREALAASLVAEMAGAVALSRTVSDPALSQRLLDQSHRSVRARAGLTNSTMDP